MAPKIIMVLPPPHRNCLLIRSILLACVNGLNERHVLFLYSQVKETYSATSTNQLMALQ